MVLAFFLDFSKGDGFLGESRRPLLAFFSDHNIRSIELHLYLLSGLQNALAQAKFDRNLPIAVDCALMLQVHASKEQWVHPGLNAFIFSPIEFIQPAVAS